MLLYPGFRLINVHNGSVQNLALPHGQVEYKPQLKYQYQKTCAFDPTLTIRRGPYHHDTLELTALLNQPGQYDQLLDFLCLPGDLYVEFESSGSTRQFKVLSEKLPPRADLLRVYGGRGKCELESIYKTASSIDFTTVFGWGNSWGSNYGY